MAMVPLSEWSTPTLTASAACAETPVRAIAASAEGMNLGIIVLECLYWIVKLETTRLKKQAGEHRYRMIHRTLPPQPFNTRKWD
jgi:hypothetical protein